MARTARVISGKIGGRGVDGAGLHGGMDIPVINDFLLRYVAGAQAVTPDVKGATHMRRPATFPFERLAGLTLDVARRHSEAIGSEYNFGHGGRTGERAAKVG
jgi:basic membrane lipoprotein Med (substrate-binding protein (PBP1-ABC) superfamily)